MTDQKKAPNDAEVKEALTWADARGGYYARILAAALRAHQEPQAGQAKCKCQHECGDDFTSETGKCRAGRPASPAAPERSKP